MATGTGYTYHRGRLCCTCIAAWLPVYERMLMHRGITSGMVGGQLRIFQLTGTADASAGTHAQGGAIDSAMLDPRGIRLAREMGASASWIRWWPGNLHAHMVLDGCPHNGPARYQIDAVKAGYDGTGYMGRGAVDREWRPAQWRTWRTGLAWARTELGIAELMKEAGMNDADMEKLANLVARKVWTYGWGNNKLNAGQRLERAYQNTEPIKRNGKFRSLRQVIADIETAVLPVRRNGRHISVRQEIADAKTTALAILAAVTNKTGGASVRMPLALVPDGSVDTATDAANQDDDKEN